MARAAPGSQIREPDLTLKPALDQTEAGIVRNLTQHFVECCVQFRKIGFHRVRTASLSFKLARELQVQLQVELELEP